MEHPSKSLPVLTEEEIKPQAKKSRRKSENPSSTPVSKKQSGGKNFNNDSRESSGRSPRARGSRNRKSRAQRATEQSTRAKRNINLTSNQPSPTGKDSKKDGSERRRRDNQSQNRK